ncbi:MAG TPA: alginate export family protein, partial [Planctomycetota bacterium]|nr:alginate export family protein [Planctomycetota bacterium]
MLLSLLAVRTGPAQQAEAPRAPPPYRQLRYEEDYSYLRDASRRADPFDPLKYIPLSESGDAYLSLGGEVRERYERFHNANWGAGPQDDTGYFLQRYMAHADLHVGEDLRLFAQLKSGLEEGRTGGPRVPDEDRLDLHQAFGDWEIPLDPGRSLTLRAGRQEMSYGSSRLVSTREGPNVRQSFDGIRAIAHVEDGRADAFLTRPVETDPGVFDDGSDEDRVFWGTYATAPVAEGLSLDLYYLGLERNDATFDQGTADEHRHSVGTRLWGRPAPWDYNVELVYQFGTFGPGRISAWTLASDTGLTLEGTPLEPRLGVKADVASGDTDRSDSDLGTFNALFPKGSYFAETDL